MKSDSWSFWLDVGGTFTDCIAVNPDGDRRVYKVLSSGRLKLDVIARDGEANVRFSGLEQYPAGLFTGYTLRAALQEDAVATVRGHSDTALTLDGKLANALKEGDRVELFSGEPAPLLAIRLALGIGLQERIPPVSVRLGTTWGTNALLERKGTRTALLITEGFTDLPLIGYQERPHLFQLNVRKPAPLHEASVGVHERIDAHGNVLVPLDEDQARKTLEELRQAGFASLAICLMNSYANAAHEEILQGLARETGFDFVAASSHISPTIRIVPRCDTSIVDAYITPVMRDHIRQIESVLPPDSLRLMTSAGGLVSPATLRGKDMLLSGPAGGVVGVARAAERAGFTRAIGFDMGGTSTDVSRWDGVPEYEFETQKAGVRVVTPMLAIETVAAGGGSICAFDGQKLTVGPSSAGSDPGPACYGAGGPLTVTDLNLLLGRIDEARFPFALDRAASSDRLESLEKEVRREADTVYTSEQLAEGLLRIANENMAAAIRRISVAKGYDVRDYALVGFGGAAGQHVCAIAGLLGMRKVLMHPLAGVLSAWGTGLSDVRAFATRTLIRPWTDCGDEVIQSVFTELENEAREGLKRERVGPDVLVQVRRQLDLRYRGQGTSLTVDEPSGGGWQAAFQAVHRRLYGYAFATRDIELVGARVEASASLHREEITEEMMHAREAEPIDETNAVFEGRSVRTPVFKREALHPGAWLEGPALVSEATSNIVVEPGWKATVTALGDLLLERVASESISRSPATLESELEKADPILLELFSNAFTAIAEQMGATLRRTALSVNVKERLDYSCALFTPEGGLVVNAPHMPVHLGAMGECVARMIRDVKEFRPGDTLVTNDPLRGGSHIPDVTVVTPVFDGEGNSILFFVANRAHHAEIGGTRPGSMPPDSTCLAEEGVLIRNFRLIDGGQERFAEMGDMLGSGPWPSRNPEENLCDLEAQVAANQEGVRLLGELLWAHGSATILAYMRHLQSAAEEKMRRALAKLKRDVYTFEDHMDDEARIAVRITPEGDSATVDFTGTSPVRKGNLNANRAIVTAAVLYCFRCLIDEEIPLNAGVLAPLRLVLPECFLNPPERDDPNECPAVVGGNVETSQRCVDVLLGALGLAAASQGTMNNVTFGTKSFGYYETICGGTGAGPGFDGCDAVHSHMTNTRLTDPEVLEANCPVRLVRFEIRRGSGGAGKWRGGDGVRRELEFLTPLELSVLTQRRVTRPFGLEGGDPGTAGRNLVRQSGADDWKEMPYAFTMKVDRGCRLMIESPGGGGFEREGK